MNGEKSKKNRDESNNSLSAQLFRLFWLLLIPLGFILPSISLSYPELTEKLYSKVLYPFFSRPLGAVFSLLPFSAAEMILYMLLLSLPIFIIIGAVRFIRRRISGKRVLSTLITLFIASGILLNAFYFLWGFNYYRPELASLLNLNTRPRPPEQLESLCYMLADEAILLREQVAEDENGVFCLPEGYRAYFDRIPAAYENLGKNIRFFSRKVYPAKSIYLSKGLSYSGISGIFIPFTAEPNVNTDQPPLILLSSAAHESAHYLGVAREDEANFVAYLACIHSDDPSVKYSGVMLALIHAGNKLNSIDNEAYTKLREYYSDGMDRDLIDYNTYWKEFEGPVEEAATNINDHYLKFNGQAEGVKSYGAMVDLLLAYYY
ncbi:MAG: hypothetical protein BWY11_00519 [Firmicutes bacterium ADurb.Bin182]|nr:MAG: hypothetical protein BWY11_00519 [Firmicutes bacterium ADurb.Bin182]